MLNTYLDRKLKSSNMLIILAAIIRERHAKYTQKITSFTTIKMTTGELVPREPYDNTPLFQRVVRINSIDRIGVSDAVDITASWVGLSFYSSFGMR